MNTRKSDAQKKLGNAYGCLFVLGAFVLLLGLVLTILGFTLAPDAEINQVLASGYGAPALGVGIAALILGGLYVLLGYFVGRRSKVALGIAVGLIILNMLSNAIAFLGGNRAVALALLIQFWILRALWPGFNAINDLEVEQQKIQASASSAAEGSATDWEREGQTYYQAGAYSAAVAAYDRVLRENPQNGRVWRSKGDALAALGRTAEAESAYQEARARGEVW